MANGRIYLQTTSQGRLFKGLLHAVKITNFGSKMVYNHFMVSVSVWMAWSKHAGNVARVKKSARNTSRRRVILRAFLNREGTLNFRVWMAWSKPRFRPIRARVIYMLFYNTFSQWSHLASANAQGEISPSLAASFLLWRQIELYMR
jgi:hypothetical protein